MSCVVLGPFLGGLSSLRVFLLLYYIGSAGVCLKHLSSAESTQDHMSDLHNSANDGFYPATTPAVTMMNVTPVMMTTALPLMLMRLMIVEMSVLIRQKYIFVLHSRLLITVVNPDSPSDHLICCISLSGIHFPFRSVCRPPERPLRRAERH